MLSFNTVIMENKKKLLITHTVRITEDLEKELNNASRILDMPKQEAIRLMLRIGLAHLENVKYDLAKCVLNSSAKK